MAQQMGRMPDTWEGLLEEKDRILHWSGEVLSKVTDNIRQEESFQTDYDNNKIDAKIEEWMQSHQARIDEAISKYPNASQQCKDKLTNGITKLHDDLKLKMRKDYQNAYAKLKKLSKKVDEMGKNQRKIHGEIQDLESSAAGDVKKFQKKFGPLRVKTFDNLKTGEKNEAEDKKLKADFIKKVNEVDRKHSTDAGKTITNLLKDFEKAATK